MIEGVLAVIAGVLALVLPGITVLTLGVLLGVTLVVFGVSLVAAASRAPRAGGRAWLAVLAVTSLVAGLLCVLHPGGGVLTVGISVSVWFFAAGINDLAAAANRPGHRAWNVLTGILSILTAAAVFARPGLAIGGLALVTGIGFIMRGVLQIGLAGRLHRVSR